MTLTRDYGDLRVLSSLVVANDASDQYTNVFPLDDYLGLLLTYDVEVHSFTGGSSPGLKFTLELDTTNQGNWVAASALIVTANGFTAAAPTDPTITSATKAYRRYNEVAGLRARVKISVTGTPTGGTATASIYALLKRGG